MDNQLDTFVHKEYFIFMLPSIYIIPTALYYNSYFIFFIRFRAINLSRLEDPSRESLLPTNSPAKILQIKICATLLIASLYLLTYFLAFFDYLVKFKVSYGYLYLLMVFANLLSSLLIYIEHKKNQPQSVFTHRVYWPFLASFFFIRILQPYMTILFCIIDLLQFIPACILMLYALYRPSNGPILDEVPTFAKDLFEYIEWVRDPIVVPEEYSSDVSADFEDVKNRIKHTDDSEKYLLGQMPKRAVVVSKKIIKKFVNNNELLYYYQIISQIGQSQFITEKRYPAFLELEKNQREFYSAQNFSHLNEQISVPLIQKIDLKSNEDEIVFLQRRAEILEDWLKNQFTTPLFMSKQLLDFLEINQTCQAPFLTYLSVVLRKQGSKLKKKQALTPVKSQQEELELIPMQRELSSPVDEYIVSHLSEFRFNIYCNSFEYGKFGPNSLEYVINIIYFDVDGSTYSYRVLKTMSTIKELISTLQQKLNRKLPIQMLNKRSVEQIDQFFKMLFNNQDFYCKELFDFINFDVYTRQDKGTNSEIG